MLRHVILCLLPFSLSGCFMMAMQGLEGMDACPAGAIATANQNYSVLSGLQPNQSWQGGGGLTAPERSETLTMSNGHKVEAFFYRTGHERCRYMPTESEYTPVMVSNGIIRGVGPAAYNRIRQHSYSTQRHTYLPPKEFSLSDLIM